MFSATDRSHSVITTEYGYGYIHTYIHPYIQYIHTYSLLDMYILHSLDVLYACIYSTCSLSEKQKNAASLHRRFYYLLLSTGLEPTAGDPVLPSTALPTQKTQCPSLEAGSLFLQISKILRIRSFDKLFVMASKESLSPSKRRCNTVTGAELNR